MWVSNTCCIPSKNAVRASDFNKSKHELHLYDTYMDKGTLIFPTRTEKFSFCHICVHCSHQTFRNGHSEQFQCLLGQNSKCLQGDGLQAHFFLQCCIQCIQLRQHHMAKVQRTCSGGIAIAWESLCSYKHDNAHVIRLEILYLSFLKCLIK